MQQEYMDWFKEAVPYLQKYQQNSVVVKYGGNAMTDETLKASVLQDVLFLSQVGVKIVLIHGGGPDIDAGLAKIGKQGEFIGGLRVTDAETMEVVQQVLQAK